MYNWALCNTWYAIIFVVLKLPDSVPMNSCSVILQCVRNMDNYYHRLDSSFSQTKLNLTFITPVGNDGWSRNRTVKC